MLIPIDNLFKMSSDEGKDKVVLDFQDEFQKDMAIMEEIKEKYKRKQEQAKAKELDESVTEACKIIDQYMDALSSQGAASIPKEFQALQKKMSNVNIKQESGERSSSASTEKGVKYKYKNRNTKSRMKSSSGTNPDDTQSSEDSERNVRHPKRENPNINPRQLSDRDLLSLMLERFDNRRTPKLEKFDPDRDDLKTYLRDFESYCSANIKGSSTAWITELESHLSGEVKEAYLSIKHKTKEKKYDAIKDKLLKWNSDMRDHRKIMAREKFNSIKMKTNESCFIYSNRLETQFKIAYPK